MRMVVIKKRMRERKWNCWSEGKALDKLLRLWKQGKCGK